MQHVAHCITFYQHRFEATDRDSYGRKIEQYELLADGLEPQRNWEAQARYDEQWGTYNGYSEYDYMRREY